MCVLFFNIHEQMLPAGALAFSAQETCNFVKCPLQTKFFFLYQSNIRKIPGAGITVFGLIVSCLMWQVFVIGLWMSLASKSTMWRTTMSTFISSLPVLVSYRNYSGQHKNISSYEENKKFISSKILAESVYVISFNHMLKKSIRHLSTKKQQNFFCLFLLGEAESFLN